MRGSLVGLVLAAIVTTLGVLAVAGCGSNGEQEGVVVERPGKFRVELPPSWLIMLPEPNVHEDRVPLFSAGPADRRSPPFVVLFLERAPTLEGKAQELSDSGIVKFGDFVRESDGSREMLIATGSGAITSTGPKLEIVMAVMRSPKLPEEMWVFSCQAEDLSKSPCEKLVRGFTLLP
ncbi:MAG: hypothetical protein C0506_13645 [Anaerolinea sp.]|nr:hypothetical protein [Anaerolinea sp.]